MASFNKFQDFVEQLGKGTHQLHAAGHTIKVYLSNEAPVNTDTQKADIADISAEHGYSGPVDIQNDYTETGGTGTMTGVDVEWTASGGTVGPFRYVILYNDTAADDPLVGWWDYGSSITLQDGEKFKVDFGASVLTIA
jgi:hypothetical protein